jgi:DNA-binding MarR family transcriptional regulator
MKKAYGKALKLFEELRKVDSDMPLQMAATFVMVANNEGITMKDLGQRLGMAQSTCSRNVAALSKVHRLNKPGHDLLYATEDPAERRRKIVKLTPKGKRVAESILEIMEG